VSTGMVPFVRFFADQGTAETRVLTIRSHPVLLSGEKGGHRSVASHSPDAGSPREGHQESPPTPAGEEKETEVRACR
jgi:hypothetical protein